MTEQENTNTVENQSTEIANPFGKVEEVLQAQSGSVVQSIAQPSDIISHPIQEAEVVKEVETKATETPELNEDGTPKVVVETTTEVVKEPEITEEKFIAHLNTAINDPEYSFKSIDDIKAAIEENKKLKQTNEYQELAPEERARLEMGREYGDYGLYDRVMGIDTAKITPKEALKQAYLLDNVGKNPQFLDRAFEKEFTKKYEEDADEEFSKMLLEDNGQEAIDRIKDLQEDLKKLGQYSGSANTKETEEARKEADNKWFADVDDVINKNDRITYTLEDGLAINIVMDAKDKLTIQEAMDKPLDFVKSFFMDEKGQVDMSALYEFVMRNMYFEPVLNEARKSGAATREEKILKEKKNPIIESSKAGSADVKPNLLDEMVKNWQKI
jgi:uncharacterized protein YaaR (DUF327 family)